MDNISAYNVLLSVCGLVVLSYLFSVINRITRIPSVLLLLATGIGLRYLSDSWGLQFHIPTSVVEILGTIGLIMIVLEAGLDLEISRDKLGLVKSSARSALVIFLVSALGVAGILQWWNQDVPFINCLVYGIALSVISSAIVLPSVHHLSDSKKNF